MGEITNESRVAVLGAWICAIGRQGGNPRQSRRPLLIIRNGAENSLARGEKRRPALACRAFCDVGRDSTLGGPYFASAPQPYTSNGAAERQEATARCANRRLPVVSKL